MEQQIIEQEIEEALKVLSEENMGIGKIIGSNSHVDYVCEIYDQTMREIPPIRPTTSSDSLCT